MGYREENKEIEVKYKATLAATEPLCRTDRLAAFRAAGKARRAAMAAELAARIADPVGFRAECARWAKIVVNNFSD